MSDSIEVAKGVIKTEIAGLEHMVENIDKDFALAVESIIKTKGRTIICGMGKSGIIGKKIAASFASTGTPSFFMHPGEAFHGDLGMVKPEDVFIAISNSGETDEVLKLLPFLRDNSNNLIAITGNKKSTLALSAHVHLDIAVPKEACLLQLAPTSSTTATLVMGDALTVALMEKRDFKPESFARFHPGGSLGRRLLGKVRDDMIANELPVIKPTAHLNEVISTMSSSKLGLAIIIGNSENAIITDGDLRRAIELEGKDVFDMKAEDIATSNPHTISPDVSIQTAYDLMEEKAVNALLVFDDDSLVGVLKK